MQNLCSKLSSPDKTITEYLNTLHTASEPEILFIWPLKLDDMHLAFDEGVTFDHVKHLFNVMSSKSFQIFPNKGQK